jgi:hypothetical protein
METNSKFIGNEAVLFEREGVVLDKVSDARKYAEELKEQYGSWKNIPNKYRNNHANMMRGSGCLYNPMNGWELPNSHQLSSLVSGSFLQS